MSVNVYDGDDLICIAGRGSTGPKGDDGESNDNFVGTLAQWNALSLAEQIKHKTADITDDFNGAPIDSALSDTSINPVQNKVITEEFEKFVIINGTFSSDGSEKLVSFPEGFNRDNCFILSFMGYRTNNQWIMTDMIVLLASSGIAVQTTNSLLYGRPFKILLKKTN